MLGRPPKHEFSMKRACRALVLAAVVCGLAATGGASAADAPRMFKEAAAEGANSGTCRESRPFPRRRTRADGTPTGGVVFDVARQNLQLPKSILGRYRGGSFGRLS